jgi:DNA-directed RNA polymerase specialized sigma24 family protein
MGRVQTITQESLTELLAWLDENREVAGQKYESIRKRLIAIFVNRGCSDAEDLADLTITRVAARLPEVAHNYVGEKISYFCGVARKVYLESRRKREIATDQFPLPPAAPRIDITRECLRECLDRLPSDQRELVLDYYLYERRAKIDNRRVLAEELKISVNALRLRAHHIRTALEKCVRQCAGV